MPNVEKYSAEDVTVVVDGTVIRGLTRGSFVETQKLEEKFEEEADVKGEMVSLSETNDPRGEIQITIDQTSPDREYLDSKSKQKEPFPVWVYGPNGEKAGGSQCRFRKPADKSFNTNKQDRQYTAAVFDYESA